MSEQLKIKRKQWLKCVSLSQDLRPGKIPCVLQRDEYNLGDIFLGVEYVMQQCKETSQDLHQTLTVRQTYTSSRHRSHEGLSHVFLWCCAGGHGSWNLPLTGIQTWKWRGLERGTTHFTTVTSHKSTDSSLSWHISPTQCLTIYSQYFPETGCFDI